MADERKYEALEKLKAAPEPDWATIAIVEAIHGVRSALTSLEVHLEAIDRRLGDMESTYAQRPNP